MLVAGGVCFLLILYIGQAAARLLFISGVAGGLMGFLALFLSHKLARRRLRAGAARGVRTKRVSV